MKFLKRLFTKEELLSKVEDIAKYSANAGVFRRLFTKHFTPFLKENNWKGSGFKFYRETNNETVYLFEVVSASLDL